MLQVRKLLFAVCGATAVVLAFGLTSIHAQTSAPAQGIQVSPVLVDLNAEKNNTYNLKITVTNVTEGPLVLKQVVNDFRAKDESGNPEIILDDKDIDATFSFKSWVKPAPNITLKSKESRVVSVEVSVPSSAESGGHYGVVRFSGTPPGEENSNISIAASVGVLVLTRVNGTITESIRLKDFFIEKNGKRSGFNETGPITVVERLENNGNVHVKPSGTVTVKDMLGKTVLSAPLNAEGRNVLPNSTRKLSQQLSKKWLFGRYTARLEATYGYGNHPLVGTFTFWVIPYKLIVLTILVIVSLFLLIRFLVKRHNEKIVRKVLEKQKQP